MNMDYLREEQDEEDDCGMFSRSIAFYLCQLKTRAIRRWRNYRTSANMSAMNNVIPVKSPYFDYYCRRLLAVVFGGWKRDVIDSIQCENKMSSIADRAFQRRILLLYFGRFKQIRYHKICTNNNQRLAIIFRVLWLLRYGIRRLQYYKHFPVRQIDDHNNFAIRRCLLGWKRVAYAHNCRLVSRRRQYILIRRYFRRMLQCCQNSYFSSRLAFSGRNKHNMMLLGKLWKRWKHMFQMRLSHASFQDTFAKVQMKICIRKWYQVRNRIKRRQYAFEMSIHHYVNRLKRKYLSRWYLLFEKRNDANSSRSKQRVTDWILVWQHLHCLRSGLVKLIRWNIERSNQAVSMDLALEYAARQGYYRSLFRVFYGLQEHLRRKKWNQQHLRIAQLCYQHNQWGESYRTWKNFLLRRKRLDSSHRWADYFYRRRRLKVSWRCWFRRCRSHLKICQDINNSSRTQLSISSSLLPSTSSAYRISTSNRKAVLFWMLWRLSFGMNQWRKRTLQRRNHRMKRRQLRKESQQLSFRWMLKQVLLSNEKIGCQIQQRRSLRYFFNQWKINSCEYSQKSKWSDKSCSRLSSSGHFGSTPLRQQPRQQQQHLQRQMLQQQEQQQEQQFQLLKIKLNKCSEAIESDRKYNREETTSSQMQSNDVLTSNTLRASPRPWNSLWHSSHITKDPRSFSSTVDNCPQQPEIASLTNRSSVLSGNLDDLIGKLSETKESTMPCAISSRKKEKLIAIRDILQSLDHIVRQGQHQSSIG